MVVIRAHWYRHWFTLIASIVVLSTIDSGVAQQCGQVQVQKKGLIVGGTISSPGMWPWHVAIFHRESMGKTCYKCGGSIINKDTVLTAHHCVVENDRLIAVGRLIVRAGVFDLDVHGATVQEGRVFDIASPANASALYLTDDIAILRMQNQFIYDDYVQPVCMRSTEQDIKQLVGTFGTVVGWGWTEHGALSSTLREAQVPVVSADDCLRSNHGLFSHVLTTKVYCAGSRNGTSSCNGDSGGGMFFKVNGFWYLRGVTSFSGEDQKKNGTCDSNNYVVYTDVAKYIGWLRTNKVWFEDPLQERPVNPKAKAFVTKFIGNIIRMAQGNAK